MTSTVEHSETLQSDSVSRWYGGATVRNSARIVVPASSKGEHIFPKSRQLLSEHPAVLALGPEAVGFVLAQSAYKYMYEIGLLETKFVIDCGLNIVNDKIPGANDDQKREALTVVIDEGYHAYVALDFVIQMKALTGIEPVEVPTTNGNLSAVRRALDLLPGELHNDFQLISVCLAEHTLTKDLLSIGKEKDTTQTFTQVMTDHVSDEGRHANYFARMTKAHWVRMSPVAKSTIGAMLPAYLDDYLACDSARTFDRKVLRALRMDDAKALKVINDTHAGFVASAQSYIVKTRANLVKLLQRMGLFEHEPTRAAFALHGDTV